MIKKQYNVIGVMSGTSLDGIDLAYINFKFDERWLFQIVLAETISYDKDWREKLKGLTSLPSEELKGLDEDYTTYLGDVIRQFIEKNKIKTLDAVCSHGHTALHQPKNGLTYQIGNLPKLANLLHQNVVCDFRVQDVVLGGQGAPLVPIGDQLLFPDYDFCLNLGGFANVSADFNGQRIAYDICPANIVLNYYTNQMGLAYDDKGVLASTGKIKKELLEALNSLDFYEQPYPKSLGLEWVNTEIFPLIDSFHLPIKDILSTFTEHISFQISKEINRKNAASILVTGGGVYNDFLIERLKTKSNNIILIPEKSIIEFKEALIFALLGVLKLRDEVNCLSSVTGASKNHSSGKIYCP